MCNEDSSVWFLCWSEGTVASVCREGTRDKGQGSGVSERWPPGGRGWPESWSERHCWNCSPWGSQRHFRCRCRPLPQYCSVLPGTGVLEERSPCGWGALRRGCPEGHCCPLAAPAGPDHRRGGAFPSLCVGRRNRNSEPCCSRCTSHWPSSRSSSSFHWSPPVG